MTRVHRVALDDGQFLLLQRRAALMGVTITALVREAVTIWLKSTVNLNRSPSLLQRVYFPASYIPGRRKAWDQAMAKEQAGR